MIRTGSSALFVLLRVEDAPLTSSIMLVRSLPISSRRSESFSAILYLFYHAVSTIAKVKQRVIENVRPFTLLVRSLEGLARSNLLRNHLVHFTLVPVEPGAELFLLAFDGR